MKKIYVFALLATMIGFAASCNKEEALKPTNIEKDWTANMTLSNSYAKQLFDQTGVAILTDFDDTLDVFYQGADYGLLEGIELTHIASADQDRAIQWFKENILDCFSTDCIKKYFPRRIFLCNTLIIGSSPSFTPTYLHEVRWANNYWATLEGVQHAFPFKQGMAVCINVETLFNPDTQIDYNKQYREDIMHIICCDLFMENDWLQEIKYNEDIFPDDVTALYGLNALDKRTYNSVDGTYYVSEEGMYSICFGRSPKDSRYGDPLTKVDWTKMTLENYFSFGFPDNGMNGANSYGGGYFKWPTGTPTTYTSTYHDEYATTREKITYECDGYAQISNSSQNGNNLKAPSGQYQDARCLIAALTDLNEVKLSVYGDFLIHRLWAMSEFLRNEHGIDFRKFDPDVVTMYQMHDEN